ncbi:hypothetical protein [Nostoc sp.]|uniref:hypothetical protein n=1 Tax=Nostoc sp. TaxID=1180 RepID=UPI002D773F1B|nr:hypothetical protein [Nostoc sp.]
MTNIFKLINQIAIAQTQLSTTQFLAPCVDSLAGLRKLIAVQIRQFPKLCNLPSSNSLLLRNYSLRALLQKSAQCMN